MFRRLKTVSDLPWVCARDFNEIICLSEKKGGNERSLGSVSQFWNELIECALQDLGFSGPPLTWNNGRDAEANIQERLDRVLADENWRRLFPSDVNHYLPFWGSDHRDLFVELVPSHEKKPKREGGCTIPLRTLVDGGERVLRIDLEYLAATCL